MATNTPQAVSLRPSEMSAGGTLIDDADITITKAEFALYDFGGKAETKSCAAITMLDESGNEHVEYLSASDPKYFRPSSDGLYLLPVADKTSLNNSTKFALFLASLINAGFPEADVTASIDFLTGLRVHVLRKPAPASWSKGMTKRTDQREATVLEVTAILEGEAPKPGVAKPGATKPGTKPAPAAAKKGAAGKAGATDTAMDEALFAIVAEALASSDGTLGRQDLVKAAFAAGEGANKGKYAKRVFEPAFLNAGMEQGLWLYDEVGGTVTAA